MKDEETKDIRITSSKGYQKCMTRVMLKVGSEQKNYKISVNDTWGPAYVSRTESLHYAFHFPVLQEGLEL